MHNTYLMLMKTKPILILDRLSSFHSVEYFFYNGTKSYSDFSLVKDSSNAVTLHYDGLIDYEVQKYELELWGQMQNSCWSGLQGGQKLVYTINVNNDSIIRRTSSSMQMSMYLNYLIITVIQIMVFI